MKAVDLIVPLGQFGKKVSSWPITFEVDVLYDCTIVALFFVCVCVCYIRPSSITAINVEAVDCLWPGSVFNAVTLR